VDSLNGSRVGDGITYRDGSDDPLDLPDEVLHWFRRAKELGLLGPMSVAAHVEHARRFHSVLGGATAFTGKALDLGTGAGLPGLALSCWWPDSTWVLLDSKEKRVNMLRSAVMDLDSVVPLAERVVVRGGRAEELAHDPDHREQFDVVVARSFGPPAVVAECGAGFVRLGGHLAVSEPPGSASDEQRGSGRWVDSPVGAFGLAVERLDSGIQVLVKQSATPTRYPRRVGVPAKRPFF